MNKCQNKYSCGGSGCKKMQNKKIILREEYNTPVPVEDKQSKRFKTYIVTAGLFIAVVLVVYIINKF